MDMECAKCTAGGACRWAATPELLRRMLRLCMCAWCVRARVYVCVTCWHACVPSFSELEAWPISLVEFLISWD